MVELVNATDSKSVGGNTLRVQVSLPVPERTGLWHTTDPSFFSGQPRFPSPAKKRTFPVRCCPWLPRLPACRCCLRHPRNIRPCGTARHAGPPVRQKAGSHAPGLFSFAFPLIHLCVTTVQGPLSASRRRTAPVPVLRVSRCLPHPAPPQDKARGKTPAQGPGVSRERDALGARKSRKNQPSRTAARVCEQLVHAFCVYQTSRPRQRRPGRAPVPCSSAEC